MSKFIVADKSGKYEVIVSGSASTTLTSEKKLIRGIKARIKAFRSEQQFERADTIERMLIDRDFMGISRELALFECIRPIGRASWE